MFNFIGIKQVTRKYYLNEQLTGNTLGYLWLVNNTNVESGVTGTYDIYFGNRHYGSTNDIFNKSIIKSIGKLVDDDGKFKLTNGFVSFDEKNVTSLTDIFYALDNAIGGVNQKIDDALQKIAVKNVFEEDNILKLDENGIISSILNFGKEIVNGEECLVVKGKNDYIIGSIPTSEFKVDGVLDSVAFSEEKGKENILILTFNTASGKEPIEIDFGKYVDSYKADETTITLKNGVFSVIKDTFDAYGSAQKVKDELTTKLETLASVVAKKENLKTINQIALLGENGEVNIDIKPGAGTEITTIKNTNTIEINSKISKKKNNAIKIENDGLYVHSIFVNGDDMEGDTIITSSIIIENGVEYDGNYGSITINNNIADNHILDGMNNTTIKNISVYGNNKQTIDGKSLRAVFIKNPENVDIENVHVNGVGYAFNTIGKNENASITVKNSTLIGWTSFDPVKKAEFTNVEFGISDYYENDSMFNGGIRPYSSTILDSCQIEKDFYISTVELDQNECVVLKNCTVNGTLLTPDNVNCYLKIEGDVNKIFFN